MPTSRQRQTFHSSPPGVGVAGVVVESSVSGEVEAGVPTRIWNAGLASEGMSRENVVRRVFRVNDE
jgi:hypothetical protein